MSSTLPLSFARELSEEDKEHKKAYLALIQDRYKNVITSLPKEKEKEKEKTWFSDHIYMYQSFWHVISKREFSLETTLTLQETFLAQPTDIYVITLLKSGTTWLKALVFAIVNRERYKTMNDHPSSHPLLTYNPHICVPFLEHELFRRIPTYVDEYSPRLFATHTPPNMLPRSIRDSDCQIVYMCRNPKDVLVSLFHFSNKLKDNDPHDRMSLNEAFEMFSKGATPYGPYWDHVKGYHNMSLENPKKICFLTYEGMKEDTANNVKHLAKFLGYPFTEDEEARGVVDEIVRICSFKNLLEVNKHGDFIEGVPNSSFFREGKTGDWKNHLTDEMVEILNGITNEKLHGLNMLI